MDWNRRWVKGEFDPSRLQATLFLSDRNIDYAGSGFLFEKNNGHKITLGGDIPIQSGDLLIWRYGNLHSVENVKCTAEQFGFMRIIYPIYDLTDKAPSPPKLSRRVHMRLLSSIAPVRGILGRVKKRLL
jgi:hypothetical protein